MGQDYEAQRCLAAYEVSPTPGGCKVHMSAHFNPNVWGIFIKSESLWSKVEDLTANYASALSKESKRLAEQRRQSRANKNSGLLIDSGALVLLAPPPPRRNASVSMADVLAARDADWMRAFASVDVPQVLNTSSWHQDEFRIRAEELQRLLKKLAFNATEAENSTFKGGAAKDAIDVQRQGQVLSALQWRMMEFDAAVECSAGKLPDINRGGSEKGVPFWLMCTIAASLALLLILLGTCTCCRVRRCVRQKRESRLAHAALLASTEAAEAVAGSELAAGVPRTT